MKKQLCSKGCGRMQRLYTRHSVGKINQWIKTLFWLCPACFEITMDNPTLVMKVNYDQAKINPVH